ncbi:MAG TPA: arginine--tRNA ligase [Acidimicrobiia bacterium]|nr:arginine--tRNA ligase [Acidimicrobiia bacterium]HZQ77686.1 arginine--tRNA ligase [Acidimicrobiia bacterium]
MSERFAGALAALDESLRGADPVVRRSDRADYQVNGSMALAKRTGRPPRDLAQDIVARVELGDIALPPEIAGPGFINVTLQDAFLARALAETAADPRLGVVPAATVETVVVDYSAPNVAKEMHVGHLRSTIIGDALVRALEFLGHRVIPQNHLGDWGTPFGMLIEHLLSVGEAEAAQELSVGDLGRFYQEARAEFDANPDFADRARRRVVALQSGDPQTLRLWQLLVDESSRYFGAVYQRLGVRLTPADQAGESRYNPLLSDTVAELDQLGLLVESDGALCVFPPGFTTREGNPLPLIVRKSDGGFGYDTTDLAAIRYRLRDLGGTHLIYVVGAPQREHLEMIFATARLAGWLRPPARAEHVAFGSVLGADRKMFRTRAGGSIRLVDLLDEAVERAARVVAERSDELGPEEQAAVSEAVGIGAVKYADLSNDRVKDYVFDWDRMLDFNGNTAPYLQYAHARVRSVFRKAAQAGVDVSPGGLGPAGEFAPAERRLALEILSFDGAVHDTAAALAPHRLCTYLYDLATAFTDFYETCPILRADGDDQRRSRLFLADLAGRVLARGLDLLGIAAPERM